MPATIDFGQLADFPLVLSVLDEAGSVAAQQALAQQCGCYMVRGESALDGDDGAKPFTAATIRNPSICRDLVLATVKQQKPSRAAREVTALATAMLRG